MIIKADELENKIRELLETSEMILAQRDALDRKYANVAWDAKIEQQAALMKRWYDKVESELMRLQELRIGSYEPKQLISK
jgi:hypothetical protein